MEQTQHKKVGIIGGMGPLATADLFEKITHLTKADADSKHIHVIIDSDTSIPDRTAAILGLGPDPTDELKAAAKRLENAGADILLMPCNTAHYFYPAIQASTKCPILHMLRLTRGGNKEPRAYKGGPACNRRHGENRHIRKAV